MCSISFSRSIELSVSSEGSILAIGLEKVGKLIRLVVEVTPRCEFGIAKFAFNFLGLNGIVSFLTGGLNKTSLGIEDY